MNEIFSMTNKSSVITLDEKKYILRVPGIGTDKLINRKDEYNVYQTIKDFHISDEVLFFDKDTGVKITRFIENVHNCDATNEKEVAKCMKAVHNLHKLNLQVQHTFDLKERINFYADLAISSKYEDYLKTKEDVFELLNKIELMHRHQCLCHIDPNQDNCLIDENGNTTLIDWEYASMQDPLIDIAMFAIYADYNKQQIDRLIDIYFLNENRKVTREEKFIIYTYVAASGLLWSNWCEFKNNLGQTFGGHYELAQYTYAKEFSKLAKDLL